MTDRSLALLLNRVMAGDPDGVTELITGYYPVMYKTALGILGNASDAQDAVQDASLKMIRSLKQLDNVSSFEPWLKRIVRNEALDYLNTAYSRHNVMWSDLSSATDEGEMEYDPADERITGQPELTMDEKTRQEIILKVLNDLPVEQRTVLQMYFYDGMKMQEIADELQVPFSTVVGRLQKAKAKVKTSVSEIQKRDGIKLYGMQPLPFFLVLLQWWKGTGGISVPPTFDFTKLVQTRITGTAGTAANTANSAGKAVTAADHTVKAAETVSKASSAVGHAAGTAAAGTAAGAGMQAAGIGAAAVSAGIPIAVKIGIGAAVAVGAVFGGTAVIQKARDEQTPASAAAAETQSSTSGSTEAVPDEIKADGEETAAETGTGTENKKDDKKTETAPVPRNVVWHVEPSLVFDKVYPVTVTTPYIGSSDPEEMLYVEDKLINCVTGYPQDWTGMGYTNDAVVGVVNGMDGIWDYQGNALYDPVVQDTTSIMIRRYDSDRHDIQYNPSPLQGGPGYYYSSYGPNGSEYMYFSKDFSSAYAFTDIQGYGGMAIPTKKPAVQNGVVGNMIFSDMDSSYVRFEADNDPSIHREELNVLPLIDGGGTTIGYAVVDRAGSVRFSHTNLISSVENYPDIINGFLVETQNNTVFAVINAETGDAITDFIYEDYLFFEDGYMPVKRNGKWGFIDETGKEVTDFIFDDVSSLYNGLVYVSQNGTYGVLDLKQTLANGTPVTMDSCYGAGVSVTQAAEEPAQEKHATVTINVDKLNIRTAPSTSADKSMSGQVNAGQTYTVYEQTEAEGYTWYRIGANMWIASKDDWTTYSED